MRFNLTIILAIIIFFGCEEITTFNPLDPENNPDYTFPETKIISTNIAGTVLDSSSVSIEWEGSGSDDVNEFSYSLDSLKWSEWSNDTKVTLHYLDDGLRYFYVKGRYSSLTEDPTPDSISFEVDVISGPGLRVQNWVSNLLVNDTLALNIYVEEVEQLVVAEFQVSYDAEVLRLENSSMGEIFSNIETSAFIIEGTPGLIKINFTTLENIGLIGTGSILNLEFIALKKETSYVELINPIFQDINGNNFIEDIMLRSGTVIIE